MKPSLPGYETGDLIGEGVCGAVWAARDESGRACALRVLDTLSVNFDLARERVKRLPPELALSSGVLPVEKQFFAQKPVVEVSPLVGGDAQEPRTLQRQLGGYLATAESRELVPHLARALATLHSFQIAHGNLKPGNIFLIAEGGVAVADYGLGWMPGIDVLEFTDALLYMAPEQLEDPSGYLHGAGYRWDVFSFGVLAYRLLEGCFPRFDVFFSDLAPPAGQDRGPAYDLNFEELASLLRAEEVRPWEGATDEILRGVVERCLHPDPEKRFRDMVELCEIWDWEIQKAEHAAEVAEMAAAHAQEVFSLQEAQASELAGWKQKLRRTRRIKNTLGAGFLLSLLAGGATAVTWSGREETLAARIADLQKETSRALRSEEAARLAREEAERERQVMAARLAESEQDGELLEAGRELLLDWAFREGGDGLPVLQGRQERLEELDAQYEKLLQRQSPGVEKWGERWRTERALLALARGDWQAAREGVAGELGQLGARGGVRLLVKESLVQAVDPGDLARVREGVAAMAEEQERAWLAAVLDLVAVRSQLHLGQEEEALDALLALSERVAELPVAGEAGLISLWKMRLRREAAEVAVGVGRDELAADLREQVISVLRTSLEAEALSPQMEAALREQFILAAEGLGEELYAEGELAAAAELAREAIALAPPEPGPRTAISLAVQQAVLAGIAREKGELEEARSYLQDGLELIGEPFADPAEERWRKYRRAVLQWQLAAVLGQSDDGEGEQSVGQEARELLQQLLAGGDRAPSAREIHHVLGYLCGDLARAHQGEQREKLLETAIASWQALLALDPENPEYRAGLTWCEKLLAGEVE
ncbi:protein kinase domain-containing protein [Roseibacillus ishigakijimensis]|uniref:Protein kinase n=1 Tax=Roseibacillus ishigakijimensis TaxID=454146 RepID=A0A934VL55_9BACT|nr:protein kinase [Roseibacillus ishigakijimensis]MBK1832771.1 protein kinase [Roseibacillus ishigakijimensis]